MSLRPRTLGAAFGAYFTGIVLLAWSSSKDLTNPWYGPDLSRWLYTTYLLGSAALLAGVLVVASRRTASIDRRLAQLTDGMRLATDYAGHENGPDGAKGAYERDAVDQDIDDLLERLDDIEVASDETVIVEEATVVGEATSSQVLADAPPSVAGAPTDLVALRQRLLRVRASVRAYAAGPAVVLMAFLGVSGAMLPGVDAFLQTFHQLNTTLILAMAYGWAGLGAYVVAATFVHLKEK